MKGVYTHMHMETNINIHTQMHTLLITTKYVCVCARTHM